MKIISIAMMLLCVGISDLHAEKPSLRLTVVQLEVESGNDDMKKGDKSKNGRYHAFGCLQIWKIVVDEFNVAHRTHYRAADCLGNRRLSLDIHDWYIDHYATLSRLGHKPTDEDMARIWNGGPFGCFDNGAIDAKGTLIENTEKDPNRRMRLARCQAKAKNQYWLKLVKPKLVAMNAMK